MTKVNAGWRAATLEDLVLFQRGYDITKAGQEPGDIPVVSSSGINSYHSQSRAHGPGVLIGRKGSLGTIHYVQGPYWPHDTTLWSKDLKGNHARFVYYFLHTLELERYDVGNSNPTLNRNHIHRLPVVIPEYGIQKRIASFLSAYDDLIENNRRRIRLLEQSARLLYEEWFVRLRFPGHESVTVIDGVPEGWERTPVPVMVEVNPAERMMKNGLVSYIPMAALSTTDMSVDLNYSERRTKSTSVRFRNGDTLLARITPCLENGKTGFVNFLDEDEVACGSTEFIVLRGCSVSPYFVYCMARTYDFREAAIKSMIGSSGRQRVQPNCFNEFLVSVPSRPLRERFDDYCEAIFNQIASLSIESLKLAQARDLLLPRLMNGQIAA